MKLGNHHTEIKIGLSKTPRYRARVKKKFVGLRINNKILRDILDLLLMPFKSKIKNIYCKKVIIQFKSLVLSCT